MVERICELPAQDLKLTQDQDKVTERQVLLSVVMPVYNEKNTISKIIDKVLKLDMLKELIVVDDGSTDGTAKILKNLKYDDRVRLFRHNENVHLRLNN